MQVLSSVFSLLVAAAGWYYMFYSRAATRLSGIEDEATNRRRHRLRRVNGFVMFLLAIAFYAGFNTVGDPLTSRAAATAFVIIWLSVFILLLVIVLLVMFDLRLTWRLRHRRRH
jgi:drug/metabolite transporter (DMT)-like permease